MKGLIGDDTRCDRHGQAHGADRPFSLGVRGAGPLFLSGEVAQDPGTGRLIDGDVVRQTHQILDNIATALETSASLSQTCSASAST